MLWQCSSVQYGCSTQAPRKESRSPPVKLGAGKSFLEATARPIDRNGHPEACGHQGECPRAGGGVPATPRSSRSPEKMKFWWILEDFGDPAASRLCMTDCHMSHIGEISKSEACRNFKMTVHGRHWELCGRPHIRINPTSVSGDSGMQLATVGELTIDLIKIFGFHLKRSQKK